MVYFTHNIPTPMDFDGVEFKVLKPWKMILDRETRWVHYERQGGLGSKAYQIQTDDLESFVEQVS